MDDGVTGEPPGLSAGEAGAVRLAFRVQPNASRTGLTQAGDGSLRLAVTAPPVDGAANAMARSFWAKALGVPKGRIALVGGEKSRNKVVEIRGVALDAVRDGVRRALR